MHVHGWWKEAAVVDLHLRGKVDFCTYFLGWHCWGCLFWITLVNTKLKHICLYDCYHSGLQAKCTESCTWSVFQLRPWQEFNVKGALLAEPKGSMLYCNILKCHYLFSHRYNQLAISTSPSAELLKSRLILPLSPKMIAMLIILFLIICVFSSMEDNALQNCIMIFSGLSEKLCCVWQIWISLLKQRLSMTESHCCWYFLLSIPIIDALDVS